MQTRHFEFWPKLSKSITFPETPLIDNLTVSAARYPDHEAIYYYGQIITYRQLMDEVTSLAGYLQQNLGVANGEKVLLFMQNSPQFVIGYYAILRAGAVVVPINPMLKTNELEFYVKDCGIENGMIGQELVEQVQPLIDITSLQNLVIASYSDYKGDEFDEMLPAEVAAPRASFEHPGFFSWEDAVQTGAKPGEQTSNADDLAVLPYTSGTTGLPKGCMHTNRTVQANTVGAYHWSRSTTHSKSLMTLPLFHVTGMVHSMHMPIFSGSTMVIMTRWNRETARKLIREQQCTHWVTISTMLIDFLANPDVKAEDLTSLLGISGGGAAFPKAVGERLYQLTGLEFAEGYGLSETIAQTHFNPPERPKMQCLGIPSFDVDSRIIDPVTNDEVGTDEIGEIVVNGPQVMVGYYNREDENESSFIEIEGKSFFRTGDIGRVDEEGYFFIVDRVKRMINASGYNVWPTEVESHLYDHQAVKQACVVGIPDPRKGENIKAFVILNEEFEGEITEEEMIEWSKQHMAAYKYPRVVEFKKEFPTTNSGKILWRKLQEEEKEKVEGANKP
ncbi:long-chain-fatty-acid--CoA ligase [Halobacillus shinanisalinarum]|uniref:Long-chain-fatty-acid--CoA ligase n=1 Tax=Halobacillus shinanisalinarum TaxID=2932258 RepID=A0ABY4H3C3_9BACI|nr:long-chain-fatty-acid--CoA ligase [Halobacillus shinanisalinarum]UOQ94619.1 long-chain-fatty-acid--CoA ligase [Halobacillus shinanisalinarum]